MSCQECYINNQGAQGQQALGLGDYKPDIAFQSHVYIATNHTVLLSNHGACITFMAQSEALKGGFIS